MASKRKGNNDNCDCSGEEAKRWKAWDLKFGNRVENEFADEGGKMHDETKAHKVKGEWMGCRNCCGGQWQANRAGSWWMLPFGLIGPLIGAAFSLLFVVISVWALRFINAGVQSEFISLMASAIAANIWVFFAFSLAMGYLDFLVKRSPLAYMALSPVSNSLGITFSAWIIAWVFRTIGSLASVGLLSQFGTLLRANLPVVFVAFLAIGYISMWAMRRK